MIVLGVDSHKDTLTAAAVDAQTGRLLATLCVPEAEGFAQERLVRPQRALYRVEWPGGGVEFHPSHSEWIRVLRANGFVVEALHDLSSDLGGHRPRLRQTELRSEVD